MAKTIKILVVRREPLDAEKLAAALVELADHLCKQLDKDASANKNQQGNLPMNERIRAKVVRGKLPDIKREGTDELDLPAIIRLEAERKLSRSKRNKRRYA